MSFFNIKSTATSAAALSLSACGTLSPAPPGTFTGAADVTPVVTEHSFGLQCLGALIEDSGQTPILVDVERIRDRTIPDRLNDIARLSQAGEWLVHTSISKMETERVRTVIGEGKSRSDMTLSGAWTQDDELLRRSGGLASVGWIRGQLNVEGRQSYDYIAGDFVSSKGGVVIYSTAIGVMLGSRRMEAKLLVENADEFAEIGFDGRWADGPQLAQRRIAEAATLVHVANYFKIDYRPCLESGWANPGTFRKNINEYEEMRSPDRHKAMQSRLSELGFNTGPVDGQWGAASRQALMAFQSSQQLPVTGEPSAVVYAIASADSGQKKAGR